MTGQPRLDQVFAGPVQLPPLGDLSDLQARQAEWRADFAETLYGPVPPPPDALEVRVEPLDGTSAQRVILDLQVGGRRFSVDAALWRPSQSGPVPLIAGLEFTGPLGILSGVAFPLDPCARVFTRPDLGAPEGRLHDVLRGTAAHRWPVDELTARGYAVLVSCYGSWVPDDAATWTEQGLFPFLGRDTRAISLWAWAIHRLIDAAGQLGDLDTGRVTVAGHSRLGKAALWAAANDPRIGAVMANNAGCGGTAPARHSRGESLTDMANAFPHWILSGPDPRSVDQHQLIACIAPRRVYVASAEQDIWADPVGSYKALTAAAEAWGGSAHWPTPEAMWTGAPPPDHGSLGHHLRPGGHEMLPYDWHRFLTFLDGG